MYLTNERMRSQNAIAYACNASAWTEYNSEEDRWTPAHDNYDDNTKMLTWEQHLQEWPTVANNIHSVDYSFDADGYPTQVGGNKRRR